LRGHCRDKPFAWWLGGVVLMAKGEQWSEFFLGLFGGSCNCKRGDTREGGTSILKGGGEAVAEHPKPSTKKETSNWGLAISCLGMINGTKFNARGIQGGQGTVGVVPTIFRFSYRGYIGRRLFRHEDVKQKCGSDLVIGDKCRHEGNARPNPIKSYGKSVTITGEFTWALALRLNG